jgi:phenylalanyl-tRNA synthetase beta chain
MFELGKAYLPTGEPLPQEPERIAALVSGPVRPSTWRDQAPPIADFFSAKGAVAAVLDLLRVNWTVERAGEPFLHPGRAAAIMIDGQRAGWVGEIHPLVLADWDLDDGVVAAFEVDLDVVLERVPGAAQYADLATFPVVHEDLAVVVPDTIAAEGVGETMLSAGAPLLASAELFDAYRDPEQIGPDHVSLAFHLEFRAPDRTLTDEEVAAKREEIAVALQEKLGGTVRTA